MNLPKARTDNIVVQNLLDETLIYNLTTNQAFCLNETAAKVFDACDGQKTFEQLKAKYNFTDDLIYLTLDSLSEKGLLSQTYISPLVGLSRRQAIRKVGLASLVALPLISVLVAPQALMAASGACTPNAPGCVPTGSASNSTQPDLGSCLAVVGPASAACCTCSRSGTANYNGTTGECSTIC